MHDPAGTDTWRSHADEVLAGQAWTGDCDDLASTVLDLCTRDGAALADLYRLEVLAPGGAGHLIGAAVDDAGAIWIVGDTFAGEIYPADACPHTPRFYQRMSEAPATWRNGAPWSD